MAPRLTADDLEDIRSKVPVEGTAAVALWIGCHKRTVLKYARRLGLDDWPGRYANRRHPDLERLDIPGVRKVCTGCYGIKALEEFPPDPHGRFGRYPRCRDCEAERDHSGGKSREKYYRKYS